MAQQNWENGVTLPSVKTYYTERSETHGKEKEAPSGSAKTDLIPFSTLNLLEIKKSTV